MSTIPTSQTIPAWFIDPINGNDGYDGVNATFIGGLAGPLKTKAQLIARWGTRSPTISGITVTITYMSADIDGSDPGNFTPIFVNGGQLIHTSPLPAPSFTGTLLAVTPKNTATNQALQSTFTTSTGAIATHMLLVNTTRGNSRAFVHRNIVGSTWEISQPLAPYVNGTFPSAVEVNTWANGDSVIGYALTSICLSLVGGNYTNFSSPFPAAHIVQQMKIFTPVGFGAVKCDPGSNFLFTDCDMSLSGISCSGATILGSQSQIWNCWLTLVNSTTTGYGSFGTMIINSGIIHNGVLQGADINNDVIVNGTLDVFSSPFLGPIFNIGTIRAHGDNRLFGPIYGTGTYNQQQGSTTYTGTAVANLPIANLQINGSTTAYSINNNTLNSNIAITATNLDAPAGPAGFGGTAFLLNGGVITNGTSTQASALTQTAWFVDPQNVTTTASDSNTGLTSGTALRTKAEIIRRWGTNSPILTVPVTITYLSADIAPGTDPGIFTPVFIAGSRLTHTAALPAPAFTGTLLSVTRKNMATNQALQSTFTTSTGALTRYMLLANTTRGSHAILQRNTAGSTWQISQPVVPYSGTGFPTGTEDNTWANGDVIDGYIPLAVDLAVIGGIARDLITPFTPYHIVQQISAPSFTELEVDQSAYVFFNDCFGFDTTFGGGRAGIQSFAVNCYIPFCLSLTGLPVIPGLAIIAGVLHDFRGNSTFLSNDIILDGHGDIENNVTGFGPLFIDTTVILRAEGVNGSNIGGVSVYGPGIFNQLAGTTTYSGTAAANFPIANITINGSTTAYSINNTTLNSNITLSSANLDAPAGPAGFGGLAFIPGIGGITNGTSTQGSSLIQASWFIDPSLGFDGYTGTNATFTSGSTGPLKTWAEVVRRYGTNSPRLRQNTTFTFVSSHTDNTDPVYFTPFVENGAQITLQGSFGAAQQVGAGTLNVVTPKNRNTPQLLTSSFTLGSGAVAVGNAIVNSTHSSVAWVYKSLGGGVFAISQPMAPVVLPYDINPTAEVNTWTTGDTVTIYQPTQINIAVFNPTLVDWNGSLNNFPNIYRLNVFDPQLLFGTTYFDPVTLGPTCLLELQVQRAANHTFEPRQLLQPRSNNVWYAGGLTSTYTVAPDTTNTGLPGAFNLAISGGIVGGPNAFRYGFVGIALDNDVILTVSGTFPGILGYNFGAGAVYIETGFTLNIGGNCNLRVLAPNIIWGPGILNVQGNARVVYTGGVATFVNTGGITLNGLSTATAYDTSGDPTIIHSNRNLTAANLDITVTNGGFGGIAVQLGGATISNGNL
jgi:hypothetical protein